MKHDNEAETDLCKYSRQSPHGPRKKFSSIQTAVVPVYRLQPFVFGKLA